MEIRLTVMPGTGPLSDTEAPDARFRVLIAGGGIAGLEALLAITDTLGPRVSVELLNRKREFVHRPLALGEAFGMGEASTIRIDRLVAELGLGVSFRQDALSVVNPQRRTVLTESGLELSYDALLLALGARPVDALPGALTYSGPASNEPYRALLAEIEAGKVERIAFVTPVGVRWALPLYELALLTAHHAREHLDGNLKITIASAEGAPLEMFGRRATEAVGELLDSAGIEFRGSSAPSRIEPDGVVMAGGDHLPADRVVALPRLEVPPIPGVPQGPHGFIGTDLAMRVDGLERVYAAGDAIWFPIKQGGIAAQQAEAAADSIASLVDPEHEAKPFRPVLRGALFTGAAPLYLRSEGGGGDEPSAAGVAPLWWPPAKVAARRLAPLLHRHGDEMMEPLQDLEPAGEDDLTQASDEHEEMLEVAFAAAESDARWGDHRAALRWLEIAEQLNLTLPPEYAEKRERWKAAQRSLA